jgi:hypothetical protein
MQKQVLILFVALLLLTALPGCLKWYCCGNTIYYYNCSRGSTTVYVTITGNPAEVKSMITDSVNFYLAKGYVCGFADTTAPYSECVQGGAHKKNAEAGGKPCVSSDQGLCSAAAEPQCSN